MLLVHFEAEGRLKTGENLDGFIPGEAAGLLVLTRRSTAAQLGMPVLATIQRWAHGYESGHLYSSEPYRGDGLATTVASVIDSDDPANEVYSTMNGESHWAREWGVTTVRNSAALPHDHAMHHPADCFGDTGAAAGPVMTGLAALGIAGGYRRPPCLVYASSDTGQRAALKLGP
jgi:3-oxoacyl-[acyl-carrier-protein] synthase-1